MITTRAQRVLAVWTGSAIALFIVFWLMPTSAQPPTLIFGNNAGAIVPVKVNSAGKLGLLGNDEQDTAIYARNDHPNRWSAGLDAIANVLTEIKAAPGAGVSLYVQTIVAQSTTATAGQWLLRQGTGTNCAGGTASVLPSAATAVRLGSPPNTQAPAVVQLIPPIRLTANNALCVISVLTNTLTIQIVGFTAP